MTGGKIDAFHLTDVDGPQECLAILDQTFVNPGLLWTMSVFGYLEYLLHEADLQEAYEYHARVLRLLQQGAPEQRWALKWPCHLLALDAIADVHPDATFVVTHRDPVQALASNCSLTNMLRAGTSPHADPRHIGRDMLELVRQHVDRLVAFDIEQEKLGSGRLVHVDYYQLVDDPAAVMPRCSRPSTSSGRPRSTTACARGARRTPRASAARTSTTSPTTASSRETVAEAFAAVHRALRHPERVRRELTPKLRGVGPFWAVMIAMADAQEDSNSDRSGARPPSTRRRRPTRRRPWSSAWWSSSRSSPARSTRRSAAARAHADDEQGLRGRARPGAAAGLELLLRRRRRVESVSPNTHTDRGLDFGETTRSNGQRGARCAHP